MPWSLSPTSLRKMYFQMFPTEAWVPDPHQPRTHLPARLLLVDMVRGGHAHAFKVKTEKGTELRIILTARGKNSITLNAFLREKRTFRSLSSERKEAVLGSYLRDVIYAHDWSPRERRYRSDNAISKRRVLSILEDESNIASVLDSLTAKYGEVHSQWPPEIRQFYHFMVQKAFLASSAITVIQDPGQWKELLKSRQNLRLWFGWGEGE